MKPIISKNDLPNLLREAEQERFWGSIELSFQNGELVLIRRTETLKPQGSNPNVHQQ